jgi:hypothetical protein
MEAESLAITALYARLSRDDELQVESNSMQFCTAMSCLQVHQKRRTNVDYHPY